MESSKITQALQELIQLNRQGVEYLFEAEEQLAHAEHDLDLAESKSFINSQGTIAERQAIARIESADLRLKRDLARAKVSRIKVKLRVIESEIMANATMSKLLQAEMKL